ncbi:hypothetical protein [Nonomuraea sp. SBT364]|uniref:hypothetical protein n=1 Tax=Nonomuraea sp. SBT364 TaxID=1580530 RepID=UPI00066A94FD|nr:hypothetical protein [Nonomuraea sp. SBT364]
MSLRRRAATLAGAAALAFGPAVLLASPAAAAPLGCTTQYSVAGMWASSHCSAGTGKHQVVVLQRHPSPVAGPILVVGPCVPVGQTSHTGITGWPVESIRANTCG